MKTGFNQIKYNNEFNKNNYDRIPIMIPKGMKEVLQKYAKENGYKSVNNMVIIAIENLTNVKIKDDLQRDQQKNDN